MNLMLNCEQASKLISESMDHRLTWLQKGSLRIHLAMCAICSAYARQLGILREMIRRWSRKGVKILSGKNLSPEAKSRIKSNLRRQS